MVGYVDVANAITLWTVDQNSIVYYYGIDGIRDYRYCIEHCYQRYSEKNRLLCLVNFT